MQIDYHHGATYVCCRLGGLSHQDADVVAHASQYVDDATNDGPLQFETGERYVRVTSAHKTMDIRLNGDLADNRLVWVPFHFLPGNDAPPAGSVASEAFVRRMICRPNSAIAREMILDCLRTRDRPFGLHRLGIALHTFIDTWAHQGFVGMVNDFNKVDAITISEEAPYAGSSVLEELRSGITKFKALVANHLPVGHAGVLTFPDMPFLTWSFRRENGEQVHRDNPSDFLEALHHMFNMVRRFATRHDDLPDTPLPAQDLAVLEVLTRSTVAIEGGDRHNLWIRAISEGRFSFGPEQLAYTESGPGSWKFEAVGADPDVEDGSEVFTYAPGFLESNWKRFHDAVQFHRLYILHELLPRHGISAS